MTLHQSIRCDVDATVSVCKNVRKKEMRGNGHSGFVCLCVCVCVERKERWDAGKLD